MKTVLNPGPVSTSKTYSMIVKKGNMVFVSGQVPEDTKTGEIVHGTVAEQTTLVMDNLKSILAANDISMEDIVKCSVYVKSIKDMPLVNEVYVKYFEVPPARVGVEVRDLYDGVLVEIDAIAIV